MNIISHFCTKVLNLVQQERQVIFALMVQKGQNRKNQGQLNKQTGLVSDFAKLPPTTRIITMTYILVVISYPDIRVGVLQLCLFYNQSLPVFVTGVELHHSQFPDISRIFLNQNCWVFSVGYASRDSLHHHIDIYVCGGILSWFFFFFS